MTSAVLNSAGGVLSLLHEPEPELQVHALQQLNDLVDEHWAEIAASIPKIEELCEDEKFPNRHLAAVVASKVFYHLEELDQALHHALGAGDLFDVASKNEYVDTLIAKCIDNYIALRVRADEKKDEVDIDTRLEAVVMKMFERCFNDRQYKQALGIALEARHLDLIRRSIRESDDVPGMLAYCFELSQKVVGYRDFRHRLLRALVDMYRTLEVPDYLSMCQCLLFLDDAQSVASNLDSLIKSDSEKSHLMAYQVAFDLNENQNQPFLFRVISALPDGGAGDASEEGGSDTYSGRMTQLKSILSGDLPTDLYLQFLYSMNNTDLNILTSMKDKLEVRNSITHNATVMSHAIMHCGTTIDVFLRDNLEWLKRATNWAKFTATASIGVIHRGHFKQSLKLLEPYLPQGGQASGSPYQEGGALYALGLIHANHSGDKVDYLRNALRNAGTNETVQHGACLGIGLSAMATNKADIYEELKQVVYSDSAVAGEAAGLAMGLTLLGSGNGEAIDEMLAYAHDTKHEKIIRGLGLGMALICYGREEEADVVIEQLLRDKDPILRYACMHAIAMAYVGTSNNGAIRKLLHVAVSDVSDDVRRAAVLALGFVLCNEPEQVPRIVSLLSESYNAHVRYGACLAVGIACAGTGLKSALDLVWPLLKDRVDYVRQGAMIAVAMLLIQHNKAKEPRADEARKLFSETLDAKGDTMTKFGAILAAGIIDAGGRNVTISLLSPAGHRKMAAIVGMMMFPQYWYWYPYVHFASLSFTPTAVIGLNKDLKMPQPFHIVSNATPSTYAYPPPIEIKKEEKKKKVPTAQLSVTMKAKAKAKKRAAEGGDDEKKDGIAPMETEETDTKEDDESKSTSGDSDEKKKKDGEEDEEKKKDEPAFETLSNPTRVTWAQQTVITCPQDQRYIPVKQRLGGIVMLVDTKPGDTEEFVVPKPPKIAVPGVSENEPSPPAAFDFNG